MMTQSRTVPIALLLLLCAPMGWAKVHEVLWDIPGDGLQLPSISTAKCGDTIRFRCPLHATHGLYKLEPTNYNGTCPRSYDAPMVGETLFEPKKGCDFSITLEEGPDFFVTSHTPGSCDKNLKVYIHAVCIKNNNTFVSGLFNNLPALPSMPSFRSSLSRGAPVADTAGLTAAGYSNVVSGLPADMAAVGGDVAPAASAHAGLRPATRLSVSSSSPAVLEAAKQSSAADVRPVLASLLLAAGAMALVL